MGEYATFRGEEIKIGTCEDMYYLRADQRHLIQGYAFDGTERFRFPWPDEDGQDPGSFERYNRALPIAGMAPPPELAKEHYSVQFCAQAGYNVCLPCPESVPDAPEGLGAIKVAGLVVHRNGFAGRVLLCQQRFYKGQLVAVVRCGGCGLCWRLSRADALDACERLLQEAERYPNDARRFVEVARRVAAGYGVGTGAPDAVAV